MSLGPYEVLDERFRACFNRTAQLEKLWTGARWTEGPAYFPAARCLVFSDIPNDRMLRYDECDGHVSVFRQPCGYANGHTVDREGRLVSCEHGGRRVSRTEHDGRITVIAERYQGKRLNSPERRGGEVGRLDLVHRSAVRHPLRLRGPQGRERARQELRLPRRRR